MTHKAKTYIHLKLTLFLQIRITTCCNRMQLNESICKQQLFLKIFSLYPCSLEVPENIFQVELTRISLKKDPVQISGSPLAGALQPPQSKVFQYLIHVFRNCSLYIPCCKLKCLLCILSPVIKETTYFRCAKIYSGMLWFNSSHQQSTTQLLSHLPLVGRGRESER